MLTVSSYCDSYLIFASDESNSNFFLSRKYFKLISSALTKLETMELSRFCSAWPETIDDKLVWSRFLPTVPHKCFLHRTIVLQIFLSPKGFKLVSFALKILETQGLIRFCSVWLEKIDKKIVWSRFLHTMTHTHFLHRTIVIRIVFSRKGFKHISSTLRNLEKLGLSRFCSAWPETIYEKLVWSRFLSTVTHNRFFHRTIVIQIFLSQKGFKLISSYGHSILETLGLSRFCSAWPEKIDDKLIWSRFLPIVTHIRFLSRTIVIRIFFCLGR